MGCPITEQREGDASVFGRWAVSAFSLPVCSLDTNWT